MDRESYSSLILGVTGGIACGKTEVGNVLQEMGLAVLDADEIAHDLIQPGGAAYQKVVDRFGTDICDGEHGGINRPRLASKVFDSKDKLQALNNIVHPPARAIWRERIREAQRRGEELAVIVPLLFEIEETDVWDAIICVAAAEAEMISRLRKRGLGAGEAGKRIAAQMPLEEKMERADYVIVNNGSLQDLKKATYTTVEKIRKQRGNQNG